MCTASAEQFVCLAVHINVTFHMLLMNVKSRNRCFYIETPPNISGQMKPLYSQLSDPSHLLPSDTRIVLWTNLKLLFVFTVSSIVLAEHLDVCVFCFYEEALVLNCEPGGKKLFVPLTEWGSVWSSSTVLQKQTNKKNPTKHTTFMFRSRWIYGCEALPSTSLLI